MRDGRATHAAEGRAASRECSQPGRLPGPPPSAAAFKEGAKTPRGSHSCPLTGESRTAEPAEAEFDVLCHSQEVWLVGEGAVGAELADEASIPLVLPVPVAREVAYSITLLP